VSRRRAAVVALLVLSAASLAVAQAPVRRLTTVESLRQHAAFFNLQNVLLRGQFVENGQRIMLRADDRDIDVMLGETRTTEGLVEVRAQFLDVGRLEPSDPRLAGYAAGRDPERWPKPGEELVLNVSGVTSVDTATTPSVRALALEPWKFDGQVVTISGQFRGRNLFGDVPGVPAKSKYDFVMRSADAAVWVTGLRPKGKGFDLDVDARVDTGSWVQVTGLVKRERSLVTVQATAIALAQPPAVQTASDEPAQPTTPLQPGEVVFSSPVDQETDVAVGSAVRLQFSRGIDPASITGNIRVQYADAGPEGVPPMPAFETAYDVATRAVQIRFAKPLERFRTLKVETLAGLKTFDGAPVTPWTLTFSLGG
jgi:hypothetical protein